MNTTTDLKVKERPILFSTPMVKAILEGRKTVTRRIIKTPPGAYGFYVAKNSNGQVTGVYAHDENERTEKPDGSEWEIQCPYQADVLWVRETWLKINIDEEFEGRRYEYAYKADSEQNEKKYGHIKNGVGHRFIDSWKFKPSIHMPKAACRLRLQIKSISVERLHDITEEDAVREGIELCGTFSEVPQWKDYLNDGCTTGWPCNSFVSLWISINGKESWNANPWVWRIEFEKLPQ